MKVILKAFLFMVVVAVLFFVGTLAWDYFHGNKTDKNTPEPPKVEYKLKEITGYTIYADEVMSVAVPSLGKQLYIHILPKGYWEANTKKFVYKNIPLKLDERIFGPVEVTKR